MIGSRRVLARLLVPLLVVSGTSVAVAGPAMAACGFPAHVYETNNGRHIEVAENTLFPSFQPIHVDVPPTGVQEIDVRLGGDGLRSDVAPLWRVYSGDTGGLVGGLGGSFANSSCISNERTYPLFGTQGAFYLVRANYQSASTSVIIADQPHFAVFFD